MNNMFYMTHIRIRPECFCSAVTVRLFLSQQQAVSVSHTDLCESSNFFVINCAAAENNVKNRTFHFSKLLFDEHLRYSLKSATCLLKFNSKLISTI
jgi:hypothetical protein